MKFKLDTIATYPLAATLSTHFVWYSRRNVLYRRHLGTLDIEEYVYTFQCCIIGLWCDRDSTPIVTTHDPSDRLRNQQWTIVPSAAREKVKLDDNDALWLVCESRAAERVKRLVKDAALAERVSHYL